MQIGWLVATNKEMLAGINKIAKGLIQGTSSIALAMAHAVLTECDPYILPLVNYLQDLRDYGVRRLNAMDKVSVTSPEGCYILWPNISEYGLTSAEMQKYMLDEAKVAVSDGSTHGPGGEGYIRVVFPTSKAIFKEGLDRMEKAPSKL